MQEFACPLCGSNKLERKSDNTYFCVHCGGKFRDGFAEEQKAIIQTLFGAEIARAKEEQIAHVRSNLWLATHEKYTDSEKILTYARDLKNLLPDDFQANLYEIANGGSARELCNFLEAVDPVQSASYLPDAIDFLIKSLEPAIVSAVKDLVTRAYTGKEYTEYITMVEDEAFRLDEGVYTSNLPRDVFLAYSSADMGTVNEVCSLLEAEGFSCFVALRNLRHGRGAVQNYQKEIETAIRSCKCLVFLSSENSRSLSCDALKIELPYVRDFCPNMGRVEYVIGDYGKKTTIAAKTILKSVFEGLEWCRTEEDLIARIVGAVTARKPDDTAELRKKIRELEEKLQNGAAAEKPAETANPLNGYPTLENYDRKEFEIEDATLKAYLGNGGIVRIPNGVTEIGYSAFLNKSVTEITVPPSVVKMDDCAFEGCTSLQKVHIFDLAAWCELNFAGGDFATDSNPLAYAKNLYLNGRLITDLSIPQGVRIISSFAFEYCTFDSVTIPDSVEEIEPYAFAYCSLPLIVIPQSVNKIGYGIFMNCPNLNAICCERTQESVHLNDRYWECENGGWHTAWNAMSSVSDRYQFPVVWNCSKNDVADDGYIYFIERGIAYRLKGGEASVACQSHALTSIAVPDRVQYKGVFYPVTEIGEGAFNDCESLTKIELPASIKRFKCNFYNCGCKDIVLPEGVTSLGKDVFAQCQLNSLSIPNSVENWGGGCRMFAKSATVPAWLFQREIIRKQDLEKLELIGKSPFRIDKGMFAECKQLRKVVIPECVTEIEKDSFLECENLTICCRAKKKPKGWQKSWDSTKYGPAKVVWDYRGD